LEPQKYAEKMQDEMIAEIEQTRPEYLVYVHAKDSWQLWPRTDSRILAWTDQFLAAQYEPVDAPGLPLLQIFRRRATVEAVRPR
jgi:hypothetical protein